MSKFMTQLGRADLDLLTAYLVRCERVLRIAVHKLNVEDFNESDEFKHQLVWDVNKSYFSRFGKLIPKNILRSMIDTRLANASSISPERIRDTYDLVEEIYTVRPEEDLVPEYGEHILGIFLMRRRVHDYLVETVESGVTPQDVAMQLAIRQRQATVATASLHIPTVDNMDDTVGAIPREPTGIGFLDELMGGFRPNELYGLLAPSGGGKTTLTHQLAASYAMAHGKYVLVLSYEEAINREYYTPFNAFISQVPRSRLDAVADFSQLLPEDKEKLAAGRRRVNGRVLYMDHSGSGDSRAGFGGVAEVDAAILRCRDMGVPISGVIIDWFYPLMSRAWALYSGLQRIEQRAFALQLVDEMKMVAGTHKCWVWVNHQIASAEAKKKRALEWNDSAEFKSLAWFMNGCFTISAMDTVGICKIKYSKARNVKVGEYTIMLKGDVATFESLSGDWVPDRNGEYKRAGEEGLVPGVRLGDDDDEAGSTAS